MGPRRPRTPRRPRARVALALAALLALALAFVSSRVLTRESSAPVSVRSAVERFRAGARGARALPAALASRAPAPGTYVYATRGFEQAHALGRRRHVYPSRTTITVAVRGCGLAIRWDALKHRSDTAQVCPRGRGWRLVSQREEHRFAGTLDRRTYRCTAGSTFRPPVLRTGTSWSSRCAIPGTTTVEAGVVVGPRTLTVAGRRMRTILLSVVTRLSGKSRGAGLTLSWILPRSGLLVRRVERNESRTSAVIGVVPYVERATLALTSLRPLR